MATDYQPPWQTSPGSESRATEQGDEVVEGPRGIHDDAEPCGHVEVLGRLFRSSSPRLGTVFGKEQRGSG